MNYIQFFDMVPEALLVAILIITFVADFASHGKQARPWFNPLVCVLLAALAAVTLITGDSTDTLFGGSYVATPANAMMKAILAAGTFIVVLQSKL